MNTCCEVQQRAGCTQVWKLHNTNCHTVGGVNTPPTPVHINTHPSVTLQSNSRRRPLWHHHHPDYPVIYT